MLSPFQFITIQSTLQNTSTKRPTMNLITKKKVIMMKATTSEEATMVTLEAAKKEATLAEASLMEKLMKVTSVAVTRVATREAGKLLLSFSPLRKQPPN
jgi:hypothetical protein